MSSVDEGDASQPVGVVRRRPKMEPKADTENGAPARDAGGVAICIILLFYLCFDALKITQ